MITNNLYANHSNGLRLRWVHFSGIIEEPGSLDGNINSPYPARGPEPRNLMSLAIFIKQTAVVFIVLEKLQLYRVARAANLFFACLKGKFVILEISLIILVSKFF